MTLGLFPLNLVLFPLVRVPLHIYEPRYKTLVRECYSKGTEFGINLVDDGHMHSVGCAARVVDMPKEYPDGRFDVIVEGTFRYKLVEVSNEDKPFAVGEIEVLQDVDISASEALLNQCLEKYNTIVDLVYGSKIQSLIREETGQSPSFTMAPKSGLDSDQKQRLLESNSENERLEILHDHLTELLPAIVKAENVQRVVKNDGYIRAVL